MQERYDTSFFWLRRLQLLVGFFPLTVYLIFYFLLFSFIFSGPKEFNDVISSYYSFPLTSFFELVFIGIPLLLYVMMGLIVTYRGSANIVSYHYYNNWIYFLYRVSGLIALMLVIFHIWSLRILPAILHKDITYVLVATYFSPLWIKIFYVVGTAAVLFNLSISLRLALWIFGITQGRKSQFVVSILAWIFAFTMWAWALRLMIAFT